MTKATETGKATVKDFSLVDPTNENGPRKDGTKDVEVSYEFSFDVIETDDEVKDKFSPSQIRDLCNARLKSTANSGARQKAIAPYAQDPNSDAALRDGMIKDFIKMRKVSLDVATKMVDAMLGAKIA